MALTIDWPTGVITVPQADLTSLGGGVYQLDTEAFRLELHSLMDDAQGMAWPRIFSRNAPYTISGTVYAQAIEIINGYTVEFEDGQYAVNLTGSNNNIADVLVVNQVSVRSANSAGLIEAGTALSAAEQAKLDELWRIAGLDAAQPVTATPDDVTAGDITIDIVGDPDVSQTATRQP